MYESQIAFTLDTVCGWTYIAKKRLDQALEQFRASPSASKVVFEVKFFPYQLYPDVNDEGEDIYEWYKDTRFNGSEEQMKKYTTLIAAHGVDAGIKFKFHGKIANTINAHRLIQYFQEKKGPDVADKIVNSLYRQYFEEDKHASAPETLLQAAKDAGIDGKEAQAFVDDEDEHLQDTKMLLSEQVGNGIDTVPHVVIEGKRRDLTLTGAKEVGEYLKAFEQIAKESE